MVSDQPGWRGASHEPLPEPARWRCHGFFLGDASMQGSLRPATGCPSPATQPAGVAWPGAEGRDPSARVLLNAASRLRPVRALARVRPAGTGWRLGTASTWRTRPKNETVAPHKIEWASAAGRRGGRLRHPGSPPAPAKHYRSRPRAQTSLSPPTVDRAGLRRTDGPATVLAPWPLSGLGLAAAAGRCRGWRSRGRHRPGPARSGRTVRPERGR
jgi:hypothetical protein